MKTLSLSKARSMAYIALMTAVIAVCAWITVPFAVPFTMQTFGVTLAVKLLGGKRGSVSVLVYTVIGGIGVPVFSNFSGGPGVLFGPNGGYIMGFVVGAFTYWLLERFTEKWWCNISITALMLIICYTFGSFWFAFVSSKQNAVGIYGALTACVIPYVIPDIAKLFLADHIGKKLVKFIHL